MAFTNGDNFIIDADTNYILKFSCKGNLTEVVPYMNDGGSRMGVIDLPAESDDWQDVTYQFKMYKNIGNGVHFLKLNL